MNCRTMFQSLSVVIQSLLSIEEVTVHEDSEEVHEVITDAFTDNQVS